MIHSLQPPIGQGFCSRFGREAAESDGRSCLLRLMHAVDLLRILRKRQKKNNKNTGVISDATRGGNDSMHGWRNWTKSVPLVAISLYIFKRTNEGSANRGLASGSLTQNASS
jgi:hypothetical protein